MDNRPEEEDEDLEPGTPVTPAPRPKPVGCDENEVLLGDDETGDDDDDEE